MLSSFVCMLEIPASWVPRISSAFQYRLLGMEFEVKVINCPSLHDKENQEPSVKFSIVCFYVRFLLISFYRTV